MFDLKGQVFGEWTVLEEDFESVANDGRMWLCRCSCGKEKPVSQHSLRRGRSKSCGHFNEIVPNMIFGDWTVLEKDLTTRQDKKHSYWLCKCHKCETTISVRDDSLKDEKSTQCIGCARSFDKIVLDGLVFGELTVLKEVGKQGKMRMFLCECSCGKKSRVSYSGLTKGSSKSCGHNSRLEISGQKFGRLQVLSFSHVNKNGSFWNVICDCGKEKIVKGSSMVTNTTQSCGCLARERTSEISERRNIFKIWKTFNWYFKDRDGNKIPCKSSYEVFFWNYFCHVLKEEIEYEKETFKLSSKERYTPDFYFPKTNKWVEVKGYFGKSGQEDKIERISERIDISVLFWEDIVSVCKLRYKASSTYFKKARQTNYSVEEYFAEMMYL